MKSGFKIFLLVCVGAAAFFNSIHPFVNTEVDLKSIVACKDCGK